jgi:UDP:flavonoid glycosyltransferase YjiC (YdhE family)
MDARDFFERSAEAARILKRRAVLLYGVFNEPPQTTPDESIVAFDYAPYSMVFPRAAGVVHQGGVGTTAQVLRAGASHLFMPYSHDQPDNAARVERIGAARVISRNKYTAQNAASELSKLLSDASYKSNALEAKRIVDAEHGTQTACDAIEEMLK